MVDGCHHTAGERGRCQCHATADGLRHRELWVLERENDEGQWLPMSGAAITTMQGGLAALDAKRMSHPSMPATWLRLTRYVPADGAT